MIRPTGARERRPTGRRRRVEDWISVLAFVGVGTIHGETAQTVAAVAKTSQNALIGVAATVFNTVLALGITWVVFGLLGFQKT